MCRVPPNQTNLYKLYLLSQSIVYQLTFYSRHRYFAPSKMMISLLFSAYLRSFFVIFLASVATAARIHSSCVMRMENPKYSFTHIILSKNFSICLIYHQQQICRSNWMIIDFSNLIFESVVWWRCKSLT